ncbi:hypothetical protein HMPREF0578_2299 [Mobiluncus mulieris 28-1]|uniref:WYL domain-containing protein n=2 Tax=Mobiluncus mulieris TaxID=2052 RepID=E0QRI4_9ACTO|nr:WYL domain-containing protein [Mobiluncus mulieris]EEZ91220.1 hypothetical protein HMPREF0578_2299 [Mobiluncus mulieris 28-1]EFM45692.1 hypothetical protein HMPREF0580_1499 [Mobiluncus mulieris ATCC 35239]MCU9970207.1 WYL domain-containing protein [Mobiluncus mulieris]MCU9974670.1 WYL domain-containing protein [Mobiluncus mulieris]MCU9993695.1 WYL domain-containing protein [Mobiluncus mulieris]
MEQSEISDSPPVTDTTADDRNTTAAALRRQIVLLAALSSSSRLQTARDLLVKNRYYGLEAWQVRRFAEAEGNETPQWQTAKSLLDKDIADLNADGEIIEIQPTPGKENLYRLNPTQLRQTRVLFTPQESAWLDAALKFLDGKHQILREKIHGLTQAGSRITIDFDPMVRIPLAAQQMYQAILERRRVSFEYKNRRGEISHPQDFEPWKLYFRRGFFYVQGKSPKHNTPVVYHLARFQSEVELQPAPHEAGANPTPSGQYCIPLTIPDPCLDYCLEEPLVLAIAPKEALELRQKATPLKQAPHESAPLNHPIPPGWELYQVKNAQRYRWYTWVLEFLDKVVVVSPEALRQDVIAAARHLAQNVTEIPKPRRNQLKPENSTPNVKSTKLHRDNTGLLRTRFQAICSFIHLNQQLNQPITAETVAKEFQIPVTEVTATLNNAYEWGAGEYDMDENLRVDESDDGTLTISTQPVPEWVTAFGLPSAECIPLILSLEALSRYLPTRRHDITHVELKVLRCYLQDETANLELLGVDQLSRQLEATMQTLDQAIKQRHPVTFTYVDTHNKHSRADVYPTELRAVRSRVELEAFNPKKRSHKWRTYWLERMSDLTVLPGTFPSDLPRRSDKPPRPVYLKVRAEALHVAEQVVEATVYHRANNAMWVQLDAYDATWLTRHLLAFGSDLLQVAASPDFPGSLGAIKDTAARALMNYQV